jgi:hypothetical protein
MHAFAAASRPLPCRRRHLQPSVTSLQAKPAQNLIFTFLLLLSFPRTLASAAACNSSPLSPQAAMFSNFSRLEFVDIAGTAVRRRPHYLPRSSRAAHLAHQTAKPHLHLAHRLAA